MQTKQSTSFSCSFTSLVKRRGKNSICICADHKQTSVRSNEAFRAWRKVREKGEGEIEEGLKEVQNGTLPVPIHKLWAFMRVSVLLSDWRCRETSQREGGGQHTFLRYLQRDRKLTNTFRDSRGHSQITFPAWNLERQWYGKAFYDKQSFFKENSVKALQITSSSSKEH